MKKVSLYLMAILYVVAGINHFINPQVYLKIMPPWLPLHQELVIASGIVEVGLGLLLLIQPLRRWAAWGIIVLLIVVFPANVQMLINYIHDNHPKLWIAVLRLPLQVVLIRWAYTFTKPVIIDAPLETPH